MSERLDRQERPRIARDRRSQAGPSAPAPSLVPRLSAVRGRLRGSSSVVETLARGGGLCKLLMVNNRDKKGTDPAGKQCANPALIRRGN